MYGANSDNAKSLQARFSQDILHTKNPPLAAEDKPLLTLMANYLDALRPMVQKAPSKISRTWRWTAYQKKLGGIARRYHQIEYSFWYRWVTRLVLLETRSNSVSGSMVLFVKAMATYESSPQEFLRLERFMKSWPEHVARHSYDAFWVENQPVFHAYDYGANIEIEVNEGLQSLGRGTRLRPREDTDDEADADAGDDEGSAAGGDESQPRSPREAGQTEGLQSVGGAQVEWPLYPNSSPDGLYSDGLTQLATELKLNNISPR
ncbi:hypothetical protein ACLOAV_008304 [Pseudogymnoascus australis]